jgi:uncharacterized protein (DUF302 family)
LAGPDERIVSLFARFRFSRNAASATGYRGETFRVRNITMKKIATVPAGMVGLTAQGSVVDAWARLEAAVAARGLTVFARIDFAADAAAVGLRLPPTRLLVFGNPRAGTPLLAAAPTVGIDLPLKLLIWETADGVTTVGYNSPAWMVARHGVPQELRARLQPEEELAAIAAGNTDSDARRPI